METLLVVAEHRNQYYSKGKVAYYGPGRSGSLPSGNFREINCRTFQSGAGILPTPLKACTTPVTKHSCSSSSSSSSPKTPSPSEDDNTHLKTNAKSSAIPINIKTFNFERSFYEDLSFSELWAGPAYSNSPPPSSLPIPKFSIKPKRTVSLELPGSASDLIKLHPIAKSAPPSPTREPFRSPRDIFSSDKDFATMTLRRILNLDITDE